MKRAREFAATEDASAFVDELNRIVEIGESNLHPPVSRSVPLILILGAPRSGTTVLLQWLDRIGIACPTNLAARFWKVPYFAGMLQRLLTDKNLNYRDELAIGSVSGFKSDYGKTAGLLSPHEFSFFFRRFFPFSVGEALTKSQRAACDVEGFVKAVDLLGAGLGQPVGMKGLLLQYELDLLRKIDHIVFFHVFRNEADNVCSLLRHRELVAGDRSEWISVRPPEYEWLRELSPIEQVAGQVHFTNTHIREQLECYPESRFIMISHEAFCKEPKKLHRELSRRIVERGFPDLGAYEGPADFKITTYGSHGSGIQEAQKALQRVLAMKENRFMSQ